MKQRIICKGLAVAVIILFLGLAIQPSVATVQPDKQPDLEGLVAKLRDVIDEILEKYGHIPMVSNLCEVVLNSLGLFGKISYCFFLLTIIILFMVIFLGIWWLGGFPAYFLNSIRYFFEVEFNENCANIFPYKLTQQSKPIYTLSETKDITNLAKDCPCLQE